MGDILREKRDIKAIEKSVRDIVKKMNVADILRKAIEHYDPPTLNGIVALDLKTGEIFSYSSLEEPNFSKTIVTLYVLSVSRFPLEELFSEKELNLVKIILGESWNLSARDIASALGKEFREIEDKIFNTLMAENPQEKIVENILDYVKKVIS